MVPTPTGRLQPTLQLLPFVALWPSGCRLPLRQRLTALSLPADTPLPRARERLRLARPPRLQPQPATWHRWQRVRPPTPTPDLLSGLAHSPPVTQRPTVRTQY